MNTKKVIRQRAALTRLEAAYEAFKAANEDKKPWESTRGKRKIYHPGRSYEDECNRMKTEIAILKDKLSRGI